MFTGIVETLGIIKELEKENENLHIYVESHLAPELKIDQSVMHNGVCLTVVAIDNMVFKVTAIKETLEKTSIRNWKKNDLINLERGMKLGDRLDGHIVQGHVDQTAVCTNIKEAGGSVYFTFEYNAGFQHITIEKGSITIDGTSLTVVDSGSTTFSVAIIPYTLEHTLFKTYKIGTVVNLEFDVIGKYVTKLMSINKQGG